jgi:hypothetical protein
MAYFDDLSRYAYHGAAFYRPDTKNIGWLDPRHEFPKATPTGEVLDLIWEYCKISVAQMRGEHECEFCTSEIRRDINLARRNGQKLLLGSSEIRVFGKGETIYAAPTLIYHYVSIHHYKPPNEFVMGLRDGPRPPSREYFRRLQEKGLDWNVTSAPEKSMYIAPGGLPMKRSE